MKSYLINKHDVFDPDFYGLKRPYQVHRIPSYTTLEDLPENICLCSDCLFSKALAASFINRSAIEHDRDIIHTDQLPEAERPTRCTLCGRFLNYNSSGQATDLAAPALREQPHSA